MALSNEKTAIEAWVDAKFDFKNAASQVPEFLRFDLLNRAQYITQGLVADVVAESYMTDLTPVFDNTGKYGTTSLAYTALTKTLTAEMSTAFASSDVGKWITFRKDASTYGGTIATYVSTTSVTLAGDNLPSSDIATTDITIVDNGSVDVLTTTPSGDTVDVSAARILRAGTQQRIRLLSTSTDKCVSATSDYDFQQFKTAAPQNANMIKWNLVGVNIYLKKVSTLSYGTLTFRYPRLPIEVTLDGDYMDILDGTMMQLCICVTKTLIAKRLGIEKDYSQEIISYVQAIYRQFDREVNISAISKKLEGLV